MGRVALLFAGQGAQHPGMGVDMMEREGAARAVFEMADTVRPGVSELVRSATAEELAQTSVTQPTVFAVDLACARALAAHGVEPAAVAGFSLGEVAALTFAGALTDEEGMKLVCHRAELMADAAAKHPGEMRAVMKLAPEEVEQLAAQAGDAWPVNYNSPKQTVVAGTPEALSELDGLVKAARGRSMRVAVSGAFHSPFMAEATEGLTAYLTQAGGLNEPEIPVYANLNAAPYPAGSDNEACTARADILAAQASHPVRWADTLQALADAGIDTFIEVGPGKTLTGLVKRTLEGAHALSCETVEDLDAVLAALAETPAEEA